ncbi:MAG: nicotinamide-nucleotide amidohydrolase family protein [Porticoccus sp.]|nr:nicotinamide-nucleotide amidohydrolase family protein [Porticoccus sp.]
MKGNSAILAVQLGEKLLSRRLTVTCAESCTGGGVACAITDVPGSSQWFHAGFVTYANQSKQQLLGVPTDVLLSEGAVSKSVVELMALGALKSSDADVAVAVSGVAGPSGGTKEKPVGLVWFCWAKRSGGAVRVMETQSFQFKGERSTVRGAAIEQALKGLINILEK